MDEKTSKWVAGKAGRPPKTIAEAVDKQKKLNEKAFSEKLKEILNANDAYRMSELAESLIQSAIDGDTRAAALIFDRVEGKVVEKIEITDDSETTKLVADTKELLGSIRTTNIKKL